MTRLSLPRTALVVALAALAVTLMPATAGAQAPVDLQQMINDATDHQTINVPAGTYAGPFVVTKPLTLRGAQADQDARMRSAAADESIVTGGFVVTGDDVTINGFKVQDTSTGPGIDLGAGARRTIVNNIVQNNVYGFDLAGSNATVRHNLFHANNQTGSAGGNGIYSDQGASNATIDENRFTGDHMNASIIFAGNSGSQADIAITDNQLADDSLVYLVNTTGVDITGNAIDKSQYHAIQLDGGNQGVNVTGNDLTSSAWSAVRVSAVNGAGTNRNVTIESNTLVGQGDSGIRVSDGAHDGTLEAHYNRIAGNGADGIQTFGSDAVDARWNWWGCHAGPGETGCLPVNEQQQEDNVDSTAWLQLSLSRNTDAIQTGGQTATLTADLTKAHGGDDFATIPFPGAEVAFTTSLGTVTPDKRALNGGLATSTLTSGADAGTATVTAKLDNETASSTVRFDRPPDPPQQQQQQQQQQEESPPPQQLELPPLDTVGPGIGVVRRRLRLSRRGQVGVAVFCPADESGGCPLEAHVDSATPVVVREGGRRRRRLVRFGSASGVLPAGRLTTVQVRFNRGGQQIARRLRRLRVNVTVVSRDALGNATTVRLPFQLVAPRRR